MELETHGDENSAELALSGTSDDADVLANEAAVLQSLKRIGLDEFQLASEARVPPSAVSEALARLEARGLVIHDDTEGVRRFKAVRRAR